MVSPMASSVQAPLHQHVLILASARFASIVGGVVLSGQGLRRP